MSGEKSDGKSTTGDPALVEAAAAAGRDADPAELEAADARLKDLLDKVEPPAAVHATRAEASQPEADWDDVKLRTAAVTAIHGRVARVHVGGRTQDVALADEVAVELVRDAIEARWRVLLERVGDAPPRLVGVVQTAPAAELKLRGRRVELEGTEEVMLRSGRAALRMRADGDVEIVGGRISAASRGLFRLVGRVLRLN